MEGLSKEAALERLRRYGPNRLPEASHRSKFDILINQVNSLPVALLGIAAGISAVTGGIADALVILAVVAINAGIGFTTENEAERTISSLKNLARPSAIVIRGGQRERIDSREVVPGDLIVLDAGTYIASDCRLIQSSRLSVDESALTGESLSVLKDAEEVEAVETPLADRKNMVYSGTLVSGGEGIGIVAATGRWTEIGKLQAMIGETVSPQTPMERQLNQVGNQLVRISGACCAAVFLIGLLRRTGFVTIFKMTISLAVAAVPEGLPAVATTTLALGIRRLNRLRVVIRHLEAVETLGAVQTICFDKTGTVTENRMSVQRIFAGRRRINLDREGFFQEGEKLDPAAVPELIQVGKVSALCNEIGIMGKGRGSSTENALLELAGRLGLIVSELEQRCPRLRMSYRTEDRHFMASLHGAGDDGRFLAVKGSPPEVLGMCDTHLVSGEKLPLREDDIAEIELENERMAGAGLRVLGFACHTGHEDDTLDDLHGLTWLGLIGMADPVRSGMPELINRFHRAGIETIMLTGDQSPTAYAVAKELGLSRSGPIEILDSIHLSEIDAEALKGLAQRVQVFARVSPANKLQIVQALQSAGRVAAMTGDGINDGPALKAADIGVALGRSGTDVAREVADVVLQDDNLEAMIAAVRQGRTIYCNIRKSLHFLIATNFTEILVTFLASTAGLGFPLSAMQLLWINLISDIFPGLALALEPPEADVLEHPPRDPGEKILRKADFKHIGLEAGIISLATLGAYGFGLARYGPGPRASTLAFQGLTLSQLLHAVSCRSDTSTIFSAENRPPNRILDLALGGSIGLQLLTLLIPGLRNLLGLSSITLSDGIVIGSCAVLPLLINEAIKESTRRLSLKEKVNRHEE